MSSASDHISSVSTNDNELISVEFQKHLCVLYGSVVRRSIKSWKCQNITDFNKIERGAFWNSDDPQLLRCCILGRVQSMMDPSSYRRHQVYQLHNSIFHFQKENELILNPDTGKNSEVGLKFVWEMYLHSIHTTTR